MRLILKFLFLGLMKKPLRSGLLILAIASSAALVFSNAGFSNIVQQNFVEASNRWRGQADIIIYSEKDEIDESIYSSYVDDIIFENRMLKTTAIYGDDVNIMKIAASDIEAFNENNPIELVNGTLQIGKDEVIISKVFADRYNLSIGSEMKVTVLDEDYILIVKGLAEREGAFLRDDADGNLALVNEETLFSLSKNYMFIRFDDSVDIEKIGEKISTKYPNYSYEFGFDDSQLKTEIQSFTLPFTLTAISVMILGIFIIITSYQIITLERISQIGTLRSIGVTKKTAFIALLIESSLIGFVSGVLGCFIGVGLLNYVKMTYYSDSVTKVTQLIINPIDILMVLSFAVIVAVVCAILPVLKVVNIPVKNMIFNINNESVNSKSNLWGLGLIFLILPVVMISPLPKNYLGMAVSSLLAFLVLIGIVFVIPKLLDVLVGLFIKLPFLKHEGAMAARNIKDSKYLINNIKLFAVTIGIISFMSSLFGTLTFDLESYYADSNYDVYMMTTQDKELTKEMLSSVSELSDYTSSIHGQYTIWDEYDSFISSINGIKSLDYLEYARVNTHGVEEAIRNLDNGNYVILTQVLKSKFNLQIGDKIHIPIEGEEYPFEITGFVDASQGDSHSIYVSYDLLDDLTNRSSIVYLMRSYNDPMVLKNMILSKWSDKIAMINTKEEMYKANADKVKGIFNAINSYSNMALLIGILGIISNVVSGFIVRQNTFAKYKCFGMSTNQMKRMLAIEAIIIGAVGYGLGIIASVVMSNTIPNIVVMFWGNVDIVTDFFKLFLIGIISIGTMFIVALVPIKSLEKINLIERLKYE